MQQSLRFLMTMFAVGAVAAPQKNKSPASLATVTSYTDCKAPYSMTVQPKDNGPSTIVVYQPYVTATSTKLLPAGQGPYTTKMPPVNNGPTVTKVIGVPLNTPTITLTSTIDYGLPRFTKTYQGHGAVPTATVILAVPKPQNPPVTMFSQLMEGPGFTSTLGPNGASPTIVIGKPPATKFMTEYIPYNSAPYTSVVPGSGAKPTCTIIIGKSRASPAYQTIHLYKPSPGYTSTINANGPSPIVQVGIPAATVTITRTIDHNSPAYTSTIGGSPAHPTYTIEIGFPAVQAVTNIVKTIVSDLSVKHDSKDSDNNEANAKSYNNNNVQPVTITTQCYEGIGYTSTFKTGPTPTVVIGLPPVTITVTKHLASGPGYTSTIQGNASSPTCTVEVGKAPESTTSPEASQMSSNLYGSSSNSESVSSGKISSNSASTYGSGSDSDTKAQSSSKGSGSGKN